MKDRPSLQEHAVWREYREAFLSGNYELADKIQRVNPDLTLTSRGWGSRAIPYQIRV